MNRPGHTNTLKNWNLVLEIQLAGNEIKKIIYLKYNIEIHFSNF